VHTPQDPFDVSPDSAVFGDAQLPMHVRSFADGVSWWTDSFRLFRLDWLNWILATLLFVVLCAVVLLIPWLGAILDHVLQTVMIGGLVIGCQRVEAGQRFRVSDLFAGFSRPHFVPLAVMALVLMVGFIGFFLILGVVLGSMHLAFSISNVYTLTDVANLPLLIVSLLIIVIAVSAVGMFYWFAPALIVLYGVGPIDAMRLSFVAALRNISSMLSFGILAVFLLFVGFILLLIGLIPIAPVAIISIYVSTRSVFGSTNLTLPTH
jgi:uncharacterized membrane protein